MSASAVAVAAQVVPSPLGLGALLMNLLRGQASLAQLRPQLTLAILGVLGVVKRNIMATLPVRQLSALLVVATAWVAVHKIYTWIYNKIWATFYLACDGEEKPGHWVLVCSNHALHHLSVSLPALSSSPQTTVSSCCHRLNSRLPVRCKS